MATANPTRQGAASQLDWEALARAFIHPLRVSMLEVLALDGGRVLSPSELHRELKEPLGNVAYHLKALHRAGLVALVATAQRRGATEHFYALLAGGRG